MGNLSEAVNHTGRSNTICGDRCEARSVAVLLALMAGGCEQPGESDAPRPDTAAAAPSEARVDLAVIENDFGMRFLRIPFTDGDSNREPTIFLQESEVTAEQRRLVRVASGVPIDPYERQPVDQPLQSTDFDDWTEATEFAQLISRTDPEYAYRLPTEAEWEFACRAGKNEDPDSCEWNSSDDSYWLVKQQAPNAFGLHDMLGVLGEFCEDRFDPTGTPTARLRHTEGRNARVVRGMRQSIHPPGCFRYDFDYRYPLAQSLGSEPKMVIGLRLVLEKRPASTDR